MSKDKWYKVSLSELKEHTIHYGKVRMDFGRSSLAGEAQKYEYGFYCDECNKALGKYIQVKGD